MTAIEDEAPESTAPRGVAMLCGRDGVVQSVLRDDLGIFGDVVGQRMSRIVDPSSEEKVQRFLAEVWATGAAFDWEIGVAAAGAVRLLHFAGAVSEERLVIVGAPSRAAVAHYYDELMRMNNEQVNALRLALKPRPAAAGPDREADVYEKLMQLNNELATVQRELTKKNLELERANALKNQFLGMAAHDLRNPIGAIRSFSMLLMDEEFPVPPEKQQEFLRRIKASSEFMLALINDLLDISAIEAGQLRMDARRLDVARLARENVDVNRLLAQDKQIDIAIDVAAGVAPIIADGQKIEQVLNNLLSNAVKFSMPGTVVQVLVKEGDGGVWLVVADKGPGIPAGELATLFRPFQRATPRGTAGEKSTGLGLAIVKRIVDGHGGRLLCDSEVGRGTTFSVWLPAGEAVRAS